MKRSFYALGLFLALFLGACGQSAATAPTTVSTIVVAPTVAASPATAPTTLLASTSVPTDTIAVPTAVATTIAAPTPATPEAAGAITVTDVASRTVTFNTVPQRIVSLAPSNTEILFALDLGSKVVAVDDFSDFPPEAKALPKIGGSNGKYNIEQLVALKPDLVLVAGITSPETIKQLEDLKLPVVVLGTTNTTFESIMADIALVGKIARDDERASRVTTDMQQRLDAVKAKVAGVASKPLVYWELDATDPTKPYSVGKGSFVTEMIGLAGGENVFSAVESPYPQVSAEQVVAANPQVILMTDAAYGITVESLMARQGWSGIAAVQQKHVYPIDDNLVSRPGPRVVEGLEAIAKLIHPEVFR